MTERGGHSHRNVSCERPPRLRDSERGLFLFGAATSPREEGTQFIPEVQMNKVFVAHDPLEAHFVRSLLERNGIAAVVQGEALFGLRPEIGISSDTLPTVWISKDTELKRALEVVADYEREKKEGRD
jgi:putative signal transducing protein